ncbi:lysylphosphatidylglycerol synthase transmembrane domain-containing protein [Tepidibacter mesophilus]|uniref:lysylphosphatidylglycerol synthase transmembrane domain-containing protein n=1 Tax=Tepidibacter mesophilus TaxID=655607 RepID=UPI001651AA59|nr:lysylphosphatidylglycerol synthase transmembrane domain-containing protein [Tepidibacter mesophilus]
MKKKLNYMIVLSLIVATGWVIAYNNDISKFPHIISKINKLYFGMAMLCMVFNWIFGSLLLKNVSSMVNSKLKFTNALNINLIGEYYSCITPFSSGGQPAQVYYMHKENISVGKSTSILMMKFIIYQTVITMYSIIMFIARWNYISTNLGMALPFICTGIIINAVVIGVIFMLFLNDNIIKSILNLILQLISRFRDMSRYEKKINHILDEYTTSIDKLKEDIYTTIKLSIIAIFQGTCYFGITYFVYMALGLNQTSAINIIAIQSLLYMAVSFIPTPGTLGASEGAFHIFFSFLFTNGLVVYAMLLWRIISYYSCIVVGGLVTLLVHLKDSKKAIA